MRGTAREGGIKEIKEGVFLDLSNALLASGAPISAGHGGLFLSGFVLTHKGNARRGRERGWCAEAIKEENWSLGVATGRRLE